MNSAQPPERKVGTCTSRWQGRNSRGGPARTRVPMRGTGADHPVVVSKSLQRRWSEEDESARIGLRSTGRVPGGTILPHTSV